MQDRREAFSSLYTDDFQVTEGTYNAAIGALNVLKGQLEVGRAGYTANQLASITKRAAAIERKIQAYHEYKSQAVLKHAKKKK